MAHLGEKSLKLFHSIFQARDIAKNAMSWI
jgi:hypothetical protein